MKMNRGICIRLFKTVLKISANGVSHFGKYRLSEVGHPQIAEQRDKLKRGITRLGKPRTNSTVNRYIVSLSQLFKASIEWGLTDDNPVARVKKFRENEGRVRYLSEDERNRLLNACLHYEDKWPMLYPLVLLGLSTGARAGELQSLRWPDVDIKRGMAVLHKTKNKERRAISIKGKALEMLTEYRRLHRRVDTELVFPRSDGLKPWEYRNAWNAALELAEMRFPAGHSDYFRFHDLRHTTASYLAMNGASIPEIAAVYTGNRPTTRFDQIHDLPYLRLQLFGKTLQIV